MYGDAGKGLFVDALARRTGAHTVIRFNGGLQAAHHVTLPDGRVHRFEQFGSATLVPGVETFLSRFIAVSPWSLIEENERLQKLGITDALDRTRISENALVVTPFHAAANRLREYARGLGQHGSCGLGFGETVKDSLELDEPLVVRARDLLDATTLGRKLRDIQTHKYEQMKGEGIFRACASNRSAIHDIDDLFFYRVVEEYMAMLRLFLSRIRIVPDSTLGEILSRPGHVIFEPAQGVLLDEWRGFHPYTTWSTCTLDNAWTLLDEHNYDGAVRRIGIVRAYATRHGAGPFVTRDAGLTHRIPDTHNGHDGWQGAFRYAIDCVNADKPEDRRLEGVAVTCLDRLAEEPEWRICTRYEDTTNIPLGPFKDLEYQARLAEQMSQAKPVYEISTTAATQEQRVAEHLSAIEQATGLKVLYTSQGPTHEHMRFNA
jgi:adenylosuccinate synthase